MPKVVYTSTKGLYQEKGSGFQLDTAVGLTNGGFFAGFIPNAASNTRAGAGAVSVASYFTNLTSSAAGAAMTLANGTATGQLKKITLTALGTPGTHTAVLTLTSALDGDNNVITFSAVGDTAELIWTGTYWRILARYNMPAGTVATPVVS